MDSTRSAPDRVRTLPLTRYVHAALALAEYERDEDGIVVARVPDAPGFFSEGETFEEARENLQDAVEGNVLLALQLGLPIPEIGGIAAEERDVQALTPQVG